MNSRVGIAIGMMLNSCVVTLPAEVVSWIGGLPPAVMLDITNVPVSEVPSIVDVIPVNVRPLQVVDSDAPVRLLPMMLTVTEDPRGALAGVRAVTEGGRLFVIANPNVLEP